ncbi:glutaminyl-peptide cyclotransferase [Longimicrobium terrae]|uniref:Glutamine cyclotransferase n=1 Tax=Longimicrobium terrae TaxID=1639882 RepID=A0A841GY30_9BACT|nr:glutaminyl-peptide cyclotransferase [Longimicrobium terrae]MBB4636257.1 glutamine cyclotransferase [Longimicrobium terrae]MBB6070652.1 glutamine cyclotransferase [Longimicrobium terrae]NNC29636.1 glutaminyl-peptide cyclotransferase [Longimicrobium terrae]
MPRVPLLWGMVILMTTAASCGGDGTADRSGTQTPPPGPPAPVVAVDQVRSYPHDTASFTQGLVWQGGNLYESTGRYGTSTVRQVELETGAVIRSTPLAPQYFAEGLALVGDSLFQLTWREGVMFVYDRATLRPGRQISYQGEGWGLTTDGRSLIISDGSSYLTFLDARTLNPQRTVQVVDAGQGVNDLNELEWVKGEVWANVWHTNRIARIDPQTGQVKGWLDLAALVPPVSDPEGVLNGIAYDSQTNRLLVTGKLWPKIFEIRIPSLGIGQ